MFRRCNAAMGKLRRGMTLIELALSIAALGLLGCLFLASRAPEGVERSALPAVVISEPSSPPEPAWSGEKSLQETLDRLGYTVNVPRRYRGRVVAADGYRISTSDDSIAAGWFYSQEGASLQVVSRQSSLVQETRLAVTEKDGALHPILRAGTRGLTYWSAGEPVRFALSFSPNGFTEGPLYSTAADNPDGSAQLIVLPARSGGRWVQTGDETGYWEGGADTGEYLLCWEDVVHGDGDYQDLVVLARGLVPVTTDVQQAQ